MRKSLKLGLLVIAACIVAVIIVIVIMSNHAGTIPDEFTMAIVAFAIPAEVGLILKYILERYS